MTAQVVVFNSRKRKYLFAFAGLTLLAVISVAVWGLEERFDVGLSTSRSFPKGYDLEDFWFNSDGKLVLVLRKPGQSTVAIGFWERGDVGEIPVREVNLLAGVTQFSSLPRVRYSYGLRGETGESLIVPYAVSEDGTTIGVVIEGHLRVGRASEWEDAIEIPLGPAQAASDPAKAFSPVEAVCFSSSSLIALVHADGSLSRWDYLSREQGSGSIPFPDPPLIWSRDASLLLFSPQQGSFALGNFSLKAMQYGIDQLGARDITVGAISSSGSHILFGTQGGSVYLRRVEKGSTGPLFPEENVISLPVQKPVRAISFLEGGKVLVGGDFQDIYLLGTDLRPKSVAQIQESVRLLAVHGEDLVYATPYEKLMSASVDIRSRPNWTALGWIVSLYALAVSLLAFFHDLFPG